VELAFDASLAPYLQASGARLAQREGRVIVDGVKPGMVEAVVIRRPGTRPVRLIVLSAEQAGRVTVAEVSGKRRILMSEQQVVVADGELELRSAGKPDFRVAVYPPLAKAPSAAGQQLAQATDGIFQVFDARVPERHPVATVTPLRDAQAAPAILIGGLAKAAVEPIPEAFKAAASWTVSVPREQLAGLDEALLNIDFVGDIGRLHAGVTMLDDWYYSGYGWQFGLRQADIAPDVPLTVSVLPLRADAPIYIPRESRPDFGGKPQLAQLRNVTVTPVYLLKLKL
jgi:hypothetical protein